MDRLRDAERELDRDRVDVDTERVERELGRASDESSIRLRVNFPLTRFRPVRRF